MRAMLFDVVDNMAKEPDFINTWVHEDQAEPDTIVLYETWACSRPNCAPIRAAHKTNFTLEHQHETL
jgi:hypothetical protein